jgi:pyruvate formate lyase activating enzyme
LGEDTPVHFTAFHPDYRMLNVPPTPAETVMMARRLAQGAGLRYVYTGNVFDPAGQATYCPDCGRRLISRHTYDVSDYQLQGDRCASCGATIAGHFDERPGHWGTRRVPVDPSELLRQLRMNEAPR